MPERPFERIVRVLADLGGARKDEARSGRDHLLRFALGTTIAAAAIVGILLGIFHTGVHLVQDPLADIPGYYAAANRLNHQQPLYIPGANPDAPDFYRYPPLFAMALRPFALLPFPVFAALWEAGTILVFVLFVRRIGVSRRTLLALAILGNQLGDVLPIGQAHMHVTWLLALGQPWSIALAGQIKLFPALAALYWVGRAEFRKLAEFAAWSSAFLVVQFVLEPNNMADFFRSLTFDQVGTGGPLSPYQLSKPLWAGLFLAFLVITPLVARTRAGWAVAVAFSTLAYPRLSSYHLLSLGAALKTPDDQGRATTVTRRRRDSG